LNVNWITLQPHKKTIRDRTPFLDKATWHLLVFTYGLLSWACSTEAADWPMFLGPTADGISQETELRDNWPTNGPPQLWAKDIGTGYSAPSLRGETLILHHRLGNEEIIEALQAADGKPIWKFSYPSFYRDPFGYNNGPRCTPLLSETHCYTFGVEGK
jgi:hypothetical protein